MDHKVETLLAEIKRLNSLLKIEKDELDKIQSDCKHDFGISDDEWKRRIEVNESKSHEPMCNKCGIFVLRIKDTTFPSSYMYSTSSYKLKDL